MMLSSWSTELSTCFHEIKAFITMYRSSVSRTEQLNHAAGWNLDQRTAALHRSARKMIIALMCFVWCMFPTSESSTGEQEFGLFAQFWLPFGWVPKCGSGMQPVPFGYLGSFWWTKLRQLNLWLQFAFQILALVLGVKFGCKLNSPMQFVQTLTVRLIRHLSASFCWTKYISFSSEQPLFFISQNYQYNSVRVSYPSLSA